MQPARSSFYFLKSFEMGGWNAHVPYTRLSPDLFEKKFLLEEEEDESKK
jgi:hypothetical protein